MFVYSGMVRKYISTNTDLEIVHVHRVNAGQIIVIHSIGAVIHYACLMAGRNSDTAAPGG